MTKFTFHATYTRQGDPRASVVWKYGSTGWAPQGFLTGSRTHSSSLPPHAPSQSKSQPAGVKGLEQWTLLLDGQSDSVGLQRGVAIRRALATPLGFSTVTGKAKVAKTLLLFAHGTVKALALCLGLLPSLECGHFQ